MKRIVAFILLLSGCQAAAQDPSLADWFVGDWAFVEGGLLNPCQDGHYARYATDGTYRFAGERGTWALVGSQLTETATAINPRINAQPASDVGRPYVSRIERLSNDRMLKILPQRRVEFVRCREAGPQRDDDLG